MSIKLSNNLKVKASLVRNLAKRWDVSSKFIKTKSTSMKYLIILTSIMFISCETGNKNAKTESQYESTYRIIIKENDKYNSYLSENIKTKINENSKNPNIVLYDSLTNEYLNYLSKIETEINKNGSEIFFDGDNYSAKGKEYENKTKSYKTEIEKFTSSINFKKRINLVLNTNSIQIPDNPTTIAENNEDGKTIADKVYAFYLDYYFRGYSKTQSLAFIKNKKRSIFELENEFILNSGK